MPNPTVTAESLRQFLAELLTKRSVFAADADIVASRLIESDQRGGSGQGCRLLPAWLEAITAGQIDPRGQVLTMTETPAVAVLDGSSGLGPVAATKAVELAAKKAREVGTGTVAVKNSRSLGSPAVYARLIAEQGLIGYCTTAGGPAQLSWSENARPLLSEGIFAWGLPGPDGSAIVIEDSAAALQAPGLALISDILAGPLLGRRLPLQKTRDPLIEGHEHFVSAVDPEVFVGREAFSKWWFQMLDELPAVRETPVKELTLSADTARALQTLAERWNIPFPVASA